MSDSKESYWGDLKVKEKLDWKRRLSTDLW